MSTVQRVKFDDWSGGDRGHLSDFEAGKRQPYRYDSLNLVFDSRANALVYRTGADHLLTIASTADWLVVGMGWSAYFGKELWIALRDQVSGDVRLYLANANSGVTSLIDTVSGATTNDVVEGVFDGTTRTFLTFPGVGLYVLDHSADTLTLIDATLGGMAITIYKDRLYVGGDVDGEFSRVVYSEALVLDDMSALNFFDVGRGRVVKFLGEQRGHLAIALDDGSWWVLTEAVPAGGTLRRVASGGPAPWDFGQHSAAVRRDDVVVFVPPPHDYPATFNGAQVDYDEERSVDDLVLFGANPDLSVYYSVEALGDPTEAAIRSGHDSERVYLGRRGAWTRHDFGFPTELPHMTSDEQRWLYLAGKEGEDFACYRFEYDYISPGETGSATKPAHDSTGEFSIAANHVAHLTLPEWWHPEGLDCTVRSVSVDVVGWGSSRPEPTITCQAKALGRVESNSASSAATAKTGLTQFDGVRTLTWHMGEQASGRGFQVLLSGITFLSILRVVVDVAFDPSRSGR